MYSNQSRRKVHVLKTHKNHNEIKECQICGNKVTSDLEEHRKLFHKSKDCQECNITFSGLKLFLEHKKKVHSDIHTCQVQFLMYLPLT